MGIQNTTTNLSYARNEYIGVGHSFIFDKVGDMIYYMLTNNDVTGVSDLIVGSRTAGSGIDLGTFETGALVAAQYTDAIALANTTDYVGCAGIFDLKLGRAITLASGGGYGFATVWANLEVDKAINSTGGQSAGWFTIWADATGGDAVITGSSRLQVMDLAIVTGSAFNAGASTKIYGLRIDSSANASATMSGEFAAINIEAAGTKKDWTIGIDVNNCATGMDIGAGCTANGLVINEADLVVGSRTSGTGVDLGTFETGALVAAQYTDAAALANTTDYVGCAGIFDLKLGRAITLASGGGYGMATIWANLEVDKAINSTGGQSAAWMTIWADATSTDAQIRGTSRLQVLDLAIVTGADFDASSATKIYGLRIDSSVNTSATMDGAFRAINIEADGTKYDWKHGIYMSGVSVGIYATVTQTAANDSFTFYATNTSTASSGYHRTAYVLTDHDGDMSGSALVEALGVDLVIQDDAPDSHNISCWTGFYSTATMTEWAAFYAHADALVSTGAMINMVDLNMVTSTRTTHENMAFIGCYAHTGSTGMKQVLYLQGGAVADYFIEQPNAGSPWETGDISSGKSIQAGIRCKYAGTVYVIPLYND